MPANLPVGMPWWAILLIALLFGTSGVGFMAFIARPTKETIEDLRGELDKLRARVDGQDLIIAELRQDNSLKGRNVTALTMHGDDLRKSLLRYDPGAGIETCAQVLARVRQSFEEETKHAP